MSVPEVVEDLAALPSGTHCLSLHIDDEEAAVQAADFLAGTTEWQAAAYWVPDPASAQACVDQLELRDPEHVGCVEILPHEQIELADGKLRPVAEIRAFLKEHPEGVTAAGQTLSRYWSGETMPEHLEYEAWFQAQARDRSRFLCPYDLRRIPPRLAPGVLRELGSHHTHVVLSSSADPVAQLLQLFVFPSRGRMPEAMRGVYDQTLRAGWIFAIDSSGDFALTAKGHSLVQQWSDAIGAQVDRDRTSTGRVAG